MGSERRGLEDHPPPAYVWVLQAGAPRLTGHVFAGPWDFLQDRFQRVALTLHPGTHKPCGRHGQALAPVPTLEQPQGSAREMWPGSRTGSWVSRFSHSDARLSWALGVTVAAPWRRRGEAPTTSQPTSSHQGHPSEVPSMGCPLKAAQCRVLREGLGRTPAWLARHPDTGSPCVPREGTTHSMVYLALIFLYPSRGSKIRGAAASTFNSGISRSMTMAFRYHVPDSWGTFSSVRAREDPPPRSSPPVLQPQPLPHPGGQSISQASSPSKCPPPHHMSTPRHWPLAPWAGRNQGQPRSRGIWHRPSRPGWLSPWGPGLAPDPTMSVPASS